MQARMSALAEQETELVGFVQAWPGSGVLQKLPPKIARNPLSESRRRRIFFRSTFDLIAHSSVKQ